MAEKTEDFKVKFNNLMERWHNRGLELPTEGVETEVNGIKYNVSVVKEKPVKTAKKDSAADK